MRDVHQAIGDNQVALRDFLAAAARIPPETWTRPRAPGKWSPAQVTEHVALAYEVGPGFIDGTRREPSVPSWFRPLFKLLVRATILRTGTFMKAKTFAGLEPAPHGDSFERLRPRLQAASAAFERIAADEVTSGRLTFSHPAFGRFGVADYMQFLAYHTRHHQRQLGA